MPQLVKPQRLRWTVTGARLVLTLIRPPYHACRSWAAMVVLASLLPAAAFAQSPSFRYFYDDSARLYRVVDSTGTLLQYTYDANGNLTQIGRSTVAPNALSILSLAPFNGAPGQTITIYGQNFSSTITGNTVMINGVAATVNSASSTALTVTVPAGATNGPVSVTVNGFTVTSGTLNLNVIGAPAITSITPSYGSVGQTLTGVVVQGTNLAGSQFYLPGGGLVTTVSANNTQATVNIILGSTPGEYALTAFGNNGASPSQLTAGNTFGVYYAPGNNSVDLLASILNTAGPTPGIPTGSNQADTDFSVLNTAGPDPGVPAGSNEADELFSAMNTENGKSGATLISFARPEAPGTAPGASPGTFELCAGQTVAVAVAPPVLTRQIELRANGVPLATSASGGLKTLFTAPFNLESLDLDAVPESSLQHLQFCADSGQKIAGRATGPEGQPLAGAVVTWQAQGLAAEYFRFDREWSGLPDLAGLKPDHASYVSALNFPNPQGVFGHDPMGAGLGANYAARFRGKLQVDTAGEHRFSLVLHGNARLRIDGQEVAQGLDAAGIIEVQGAIVLDAGPHEIELLYYQSFGDPALQLSWAPLVGPLQIIPPGALTAESRAATDGDGKFAFTLPGALEGVQVKLESGKGTVNMEQGNVIH